MSNKVILLDIDHTLFNTDKYQKEGFEKIAAMFVDIPLDKAVAAAREVYAKIREVDVFHPYRYGQKLNEHLRGDVDPEKIAAIFEDKHFLAACVYNDVHATLSTLSENDLILGIFSTGEKKLQMEKIDVIGHFFKQEDIHIYPLKDVEIPRLLRQYEGKDIYIVDDILRVLEEVDRQNHNVTKIWITRKDASYQDDPSGHFQPDETIQTLAELVDIVNLN